MNQPCRATPIEAVRAHVLIVDDEPRLRESLATLLGDEYLVDTVGSMSEALARLGSGERFDLILSDVTMPGGSGVDLHESIVRDFPWCADRVVFMTGGLTPRLRQRIERLPNPCLDKPLDLRELDAVILATLGQADKHRHL